MFQTLSIILGVVGVGGGILSIVAEIMPVEYAVAIILGGLVLFIAAAYGAKRFAPLAAIAAAAAALAFTIITYLESSGVDVPDTFKMIILAVCAFAAYIASSFLAFAVLFVAAFFLIVLFNRGK